MKMNEILTKEAMEEIFKIIKKATKNEKTFEQFCEEIDNYPLEIVLNLIGIIAK